MCAVVKRKLDSVTGRGLLELKSSSVEHSDGTGGRACRNEMCMRSERNLCDGRHRRAEVPSVKCRGSDSVGSPIRR